MPIVSTQELAEAAEVTKQRISQWAQEGLPKVGPNKWDFEAAMEWISARRDQSAEARQERANGATNAMIRDARHRLLVAQGDGQIQRNHILEGQTVLVTTANRVWREHIAQQIALGDIWVTQSSDAAEQALRRELWFGLRETLEGSIEGAGDTLSRGEDVAAARLRNS